MLGCILDNTARLIADRAAVSARDTESATDTVESIYDLFTSPVSGMDRRERFRGGRIAGGPAHHQSRRCHSGGFIATPVDTVAGRAVIGSPTGRKPVVTPI